MFEVVFLCQHFLNHLLDILLILANVCQLLDFIIILSSLQKQLLLELKLYEKSLFHVGPTPTLPSHLALLNL